jgi:hypothetical protein
VEKITIKAVMDMLDAVEEKTGEIPKWIVIPPHQVLELKEEFESFLVLKFDEYKFPEKPVGAPEYGKPVATIMGTVILEDDRIPKFWCNDLQRLVMDKPKPIKHDYDMSWEQE